MRVLLSAGWLGGAGGAERALHSIVRALEGHQVDLVVRQNLGGQLGEVGQHVRLYSVDDRRWYGAALRAGWKGWVMQRVVNPVRRLAMPRYDVLLSFFSGPDLTGTVRASVSLLIPSGNPVPVELAGRFDHVALQAPDNQRFVQPGTSSILLPPPLFDIADRSEGPHVDLPETFLLTVFNPYGAVKGTDDLAAVVDSLPHPLVWCHSQGTLKFTLPQGLAGHPRIIHVEDPTPGQLRHLYERSAAYLSFSRTEGFGWSIADALRYTPIVISRRIGVLTYPECDLEGVVDVGSTWQVDWDRLPDCRRPVARDVTWLSREAFVRRLQYLVDATRGGRRCD